MSGNDNFCLLLFCVPDKIPRCFVEKIPQACLPFPAECMEPFGLFLRMRYLLHCGDIRLQDGRAKLNKKYLSTEIEE